MTAFGLPSAAWAMDSEHVSTLIGRINNLTALEAVRPHKADGGQRLGIRDGVGILYVSGPLVKRESWISRALGLTTYETLRTDLQAALDDKKIQAIALYVDSPGGEVSGCDELAAAIYDARSKKPIEAYVGGPGCSAAYWIASATSRITVSSTAMLGSIGVTMSVQDPSSRQRQTIFVSSRSPNKGFVPDRIQRTVDDLAEVFIKAVAKHRNVTTDIVTTKFGAGGVEIGKNAVALGMADQVGDFEKFLASLRRRPVPIAVKPLSAAKADAAPALRYAPPAAAIQLSKAEMARIEAAVKADLAVKARIRAIFNSPAGLKLPDRASHYAYETDLPAEKAIAELDKELIQAGWKAAFERVQNPGGIEI